MVIGRGGQASAQVVPITREPEPELANPREGAPVRRSDFGPSPDIHLVDYRLAALERLSLLRDKGALSIEEFDSEKALVLRLPADEVQLRTEALQPRRGPSLLGRLLQWKIVAAGAVIGVGISAATAPQELLHLYDQAMRLI